MHFGDDILPKHFCTIDREYLDDGGPRVTGSCEGLGRQGGRAGKCLGGSETFTVPSAISLDKKYLPT